MRPSRTSGRSSRGFRPGMREVSFSTKALGCPDMTRMENLCLVVWRHPDKRQCHLSWRLSKECAYIEYRMHRKIGIFRGGIKVLEHIANFLSDVQPLRTFFLDFSHEGLFGRLIGFYLSAG